MNPMLSFVVVFLVFALLLLSGVSSHEVGRQDFDLSEPLNGVVFKRTKAASAATPDRYSSRFSRLRRLKGKPKLWKRPSLAKLDHHKSWNGTSPDKVAAKYQNVSDFSDLTPQYAIQCAWDGRRVWLLMDTGSSDTWVAKTGFKCVDNLGDRRHEAACRFGSPLIGDFQSKPIDDMHFHLKYGSDEEVSGPMGFSDISCGGVSVTRQQVGLANKTYWKGDKISVGVLGLAYPSLTSAFFGNLKDEQPFTAAPYKPFLTSAIAQHLIDPVFSIALIRNSSEGIIAWGGLPPVQLKKGPPARTDLIVANLIDQGDTSWEYSFYTIIPDGIAYNSTLDTTKYPYIVDTSTAMLLLPPPLAKDIASAFVPPAMYLSQFDTYFAPCHAIAPRIAVVISGVKFWINPANMVYQKFKDPVSGYCATAMTSGNDGPYILGSPFLETAVAVFDVGAAEMRFYRKE